MQHETTLHSCTKSSVQNKQEENTGFIIMIHYKSNTNTLWQNINGTVNLMVNLTINLLEISSPINTMILIY